MGLTWLFPATTSLLHPSGSCGGSWPGRFSGSGVPSRGICLGRLCLICSSTVILKRLRRRSVSARRLQSPSRLLPRSSLDPPRRTGVARRALPFRTGPLMVNLSLLQLSKLPKLLQLPLYLLQLLPPLSKSQKTGPLRLRLVTGPHSLDLLLERPTPGEDPTSGRVEAIYFVMLCLE